MRSPVRHSEFLRLQFSISNFQFVNCDHPPRRRGAPDERRWNTLKSPRAQSQSAAGIGSRHPRATPDLTGTSITRTSRKIPQNSPSNTLFTPFAHALPSNSHNFPQIPSICLKIALHPAVPSVRLIAINAFLEIDSPLILIVLVLSIDSFLILIVLATDLKSFLILSRFRFCRHPLVTADLRPIPSVPLVLPVL